MNKIVKAQLIAFVIFCLYYLVRVIGINYHPASVWSHFFWGILLKDSLFLIFYIILVYILFSLLRRPQKTGPTIIPSQKLKIALYWVLGFWWLAIVLHIIFDPLQLFFPLDQFFIFKFANFLDETISHIFLYVPFILTTIIGLFLEIERPFKKKLSKIDYLVIWPFSLLGGIMWGLNLTEGRLSLFTSFPISILYLIITLVFFKKHSLKFQSRPMSLTFFIFFLSGAIAFSYWGLRFHGFPELFNYLK